MLLTWPRPNASWKFFSYFTKRAILELFLYLLLVLINLETNIKNGLILYLTKDMYLVFCSVGCWEMYYYLKIVCQSYSNWILNKTKCIRVLKGGFNHIGVLFKIKNINGIKHGVVCNDQKLSICIQNKH